MSGDLVIQLGQEALMVVLIVSAPMLGLGLAVGLAVSVFQATTSIQEQTLAFIPKIIAVFVAILIFGPGCSESWLNFFRGYLSNCRDVSAKSFLSEVSKFDFAQAHENYSNRYNKCLPAHVLELYALLWSS